MLTIDEMLGNQARLQKRFEGVWEGDSPDTAKNHLLYAVEEIGEVSAIMKKLGVQAVLHDPQVRYAFCEEMGDVFMYLCDVLQCLSITPEEFAAAYRAKMVRNFGRDFEAEHEVFRQNTTENAPEQA